MKDEQTKHTPTPYTFEGGDNHSVEINIGETTASITRCDKNTGKYVISRGEMIANAEFIVTACNSYEKLKQQNEELLRLLQGADKYLSPNKLNYLGSGSKWHQDVKTTLTKHSKQ